MARFPRYMKVIKNRDGKKLSESTFTVSLNKWYLHELVIEIYLEFVRKNCSGCWENLGALLFSPFFLMYIYLKLLFVNTKPITSTDNE